MQILVRYADLINICRPQWHLQQYDMISSDEDLMMVMPWWWEWCIINAYSTMVMCYGQLAVIWTVDSGLFIRQYDDQIDQQWLMSKVDEQLDQQYWCSIWQWWHGQKDDVAVISTRMIWQWLEYRGCWAAVSKWTRWLMSSVTIELMWWAALMMWQRFLVYDDMSMVT